ncbi:MAG TPA: CDP-alcohol phosphatidyltransferase family protein [bacterium]|nr:CDP-alcohol phosphatidyltransferase family protein [bacterium]
MSTPPVIVIIPSRPLDTQRPVLGASFTERAAVTIARYYGVATVYAPHLPSSSRFRGIAIESALPTVTDTVILADPLLLFDGPFLRNLTVNFDPPVVACDPSTLEPIGFARLRAADLSDDFFDDPWPRLREFTDRRQDTRVAVIAARYFAVRAVADLAAAEQYLLRSLVHKGDDIVERNLTRPISRFLTSWTANYRVSPDLWTLLAMLLGITAALFPLLTGSLEGIISPLLLCAAAVISAVDGETARLTFRTSRQGGILNYYSSRIVVWAYFLTVTLLSRDIPWAYFPGIAFSLLYPLLVIRYDRYRHRAETPGGPVRRIERAIRRHFSIHTVALMAILCAIAGILPVAARAALPLAAAGAMLVLYEAIAGKLERRKRP